MIPVRLELYNFLPYRNPDPLFFEGIHLACLTGSNGAGKTSLLDAITWVLWGRARARRDDDLVHLGQSEMYVQLDFEQEGVIYRVHRRRKSGKRGHGELNLFVIQDDGSPRIITEPSIRETQARIESILRLDYETFVNSAFLQQGEADAFTTKTPSERKRILSNILGLEHWKVYEGRVKEKLKEIDNTLASIDGVLGAIEEDLAKESQFKDDKAAAEEAYQLADDALQQAQARYEEVADSPAELRSAQEKSTGIQRRIKNYQDDLAAVEREIAKLGERIATQEEILNLAERIEAGYETLRDARAIDSDLSGKLRQMSDLDKRYNDLKEQLAKAEAELQQEKRDYEATIRETQRLLNNDSRDDLAAVQGQIAALEELDSERTQLQKSLGDLREERSGLKSDQKALIAEGKDLNERIDTLEATDGATCPLCGQPLDDDHREEILSEVIEKRDTMRANYKAASVRINEIAELVKDREKRIAQLGDELAALPRLRSKAGALQKQIEDAEAAQSRLDTAQTKLDEVRQTLETNDFAHELRDQLNAVEAERQEIGYDPDAHDTAQSQLDEYAEYERQYQDLEFARKMLPGEKEALTNAQTRKEKIEAAIETESIAQAELEDEIENLTRLVEEANKREKEVARQRTAATQAREKVIIAEQQLTALERQRQRKKELQARRTDTEHQQALYNDLRQAFGKNGVPAMIIESAIPELEASANELLARMTDGRMHLRFSTQREKVSGGTMETLDIDIADELGTRAYEMYSGGEAFRINFAIRVALSKMLARRAGAHLRTLFIDEGFGTQDDDGRNKLVEAIQAVQEDFDLILVITHIEELRDAFPVHIIVEKTASGSAVLVR